MKNINIQLLIIFMSVLGLTNIIDAKYKHAQTKIIPFTPTLSFGGSQAQGEYTVKGQTATITNIDTTYSFTDVTQSLNAKIPHNKKNTSKVLVEIGSLSGTNQFGMPVTKYLFGLPRDLPSTELEKKSTDFAQALPTEFDTKPIAMSSQTEFQPSPEFTGDGLIGMYDNNTKSATIHDPSGKNQQIYSFEHVQPSGEKCLKGLIFIGSYGSAPRCSKGTPKVCSHVIERINLYGITTKTQ